MASPAPFPSLCSGEDLDAETVVSHSSSSGRPAPPAGDSSGRAVGESLDSIVSGASSGSTPIVAFGHREGSSPPNPSASRGASPFDGSQRPPPPPKRQLSNLMSQSLRGALSIGKWALQSAYSTVRGSMTDIAGMAHGGGSGSTGPAGGGGVGEEGGEGAGAASTAPLPPREQANAKLAELASTFATTQAVRIRVCTWNVGLQSPDKCDLRAWLIQDLVLKDPTAFSTAAAAASAASSDMPDLVVVGLQEVELGGAAILMEMTEASVAWTEAITEALNKVASERQHKFYYSKLQHAQLVGMAAILIGRSDHAGWTSHTKVSVSRTGVMKGMVGNKGSIGIRTTFYGRRFLFICAHFHPHAKNGAKRCQNYHDALSSLDFSSLAATADDELDIATTFADAAEKKLTGRSSGSAGASASGTGRSKGSGYSAWTRFFAPKARKTTAQDNEQKLLLAHDYVFFFGDLNFRLVQVGAASIRETLQRQQFKELLQYDELAAFARQGEVFGSFAEPEICFPPTYKFDPGTDVYDTSAKRRDPAWTDRILFRCLQPASLPGAGPLLTPPAVVVEGAAVLHSPLRRAGSDSVATFDSAANSAPAGSIKTPARGTTPVESHADPEATSPPASGPGTLAFSQPPPLTPGPGQRGRSGSNNPTTSTGTASLVPFDVVPNRIVVESYDSCTALKMSDHRPVSAEFCAAVLQLDREQLQRAMFQLRELLPELAGNVDELAFV